MKDITLLTRLNSLKQIDPQSLQRDQGKVGDVQKGPSFNVVLKNAIEEVSGLEKEADKAIQALAAGRHDNIHEAMIALQKADLSFKAMMEIRDKLINAYKEIMRMPV